MSAPADPQSPASDVALEVRGLVKHYGGRAVVDGLDLTARRGAVTALLGPNGAGKTTTVEICEGFRTADAGSVRVLGLDPARDGRALKPRVGVMLQAGGVYPGARPHEMIALVAAFHADPLDPAGLVRRVGLAEAARTPYRRLSGGQRQRLALALAIVGRPELVFLDEPTAGLDPQARQITWQIVEELRAGGAAVVLTTHDMAEAERLSDAVVVIDRGRTVAAGSTGEVTAADRGHLLSFAAAPGLNLAAMRSALPSAVVAREVEPGRYEIRSGATLSADDADALAAWVLAGASAWCAQRGVLMRDIHAGGRSLESAYLDLTGGQAS